MGYNFHLFRETEPVGRHRTASFLKPLIEKLSPQMNLRLEVPDTWVIPPVPEAWQHTLNKGGGRIWNATEELRGWLRDMLVRKVPGPLIISAVFQGEDLGLQPPPEFFSIRYYMDAPLSPEERTDFLVGRLETMMEVLTSPSVQSYFTYNAVPSDQWHPHIHIQSMDRLPRRGSFYYPDLTANLWGGKPYRALAIPGWWSPAHPDFPRPVEFEPGEPIGLGPAKLLALDAHSGELISISRRLARAHGTQLLPPIGQKDDLPPSRQTTRHQTFSNILLRLLTTFMEEVGEPLRMLLTLYPGASYEDPVINLHHVVPYLPRRYSLPIAFPEGMGKKVVVPPSPARGEGSRIARYVAFMSECRDSGAVLSCLDYIDRMGEGVILFIDRHPSQVDTSVLSHRAVMASVWDMEPARTELPGAHIWAGPQTGDIDRSKLISAPLPGDSGIYLSPCPLKISFTDGKGMVWL